MRSEADIIHVEVAIARRLSFDLERMEQDPVWNQIVAQNQAVADAAGEPLVIEQVMARYLQHYIVRDQFPHQTPTTNGPGDIGEIKLDVRWPQ